MKCVWHYTKDGEFPTSDCNMLCYVDYKGYITVHHCADGKYYGIESGDLIDVANIDMWADLNDVIERAGF